MRPGLLEYNRRERPQLKKDHGIIRIKRIGICGTDLHAFEGTQPFFNYPRILGHEAAGELIEFDNAPGFKQGEVVSFIPYSSCDKCIACRMGKPNCCVHLQVYGVHADGGMTEYLLVPSSSLLHGDGLTVDELALVEPLAIGAHAVRRAAIQPGEFILVVGAGPIGLATMEFARIARANVIASDINGQRLEFCRKNLKANYIVNASGNNVKKQLIEITNGDMPSAVIDATGNLNAINGAFQYMAHGARYVLVGLQKESISFSHPEFHKREGTLLSSRNATRQDFEQAISCIRKEEIKPLAYITHRVHFDKVAEEFESWLHPQNAVIKAMVEIE
jgi:2-desacetyl-2-hydroxyethyl bacteriochlorophyllide A dehydrogenase